MYVDLTLLLNRLVVTCVIALALGFKGLSVVQASDKQSSQGLIKLSISDVKGSELRLKARQMPLAQVLDAIAQRVHIPIHYSGLSEVAINASCPRSLLKQLLECLLNKNADLIVRYSRRNDSSKGQLAEAWVLGAKPKAAIAKSDALKETNTPKSCPK